MTRITIITVCYNAFNDLKKTVESVFKQSLAYPYIEHLIIDGNSTDQTKDYLKSITYPYLNYISEKDKGIYDAMNKGIKLAKSPFLLFLNAGDYIEGDVLSKFQNKPCYIPVYYKMLGRRLKRYPVRNYKQGLPYNHQGIIFEKKTDILYNINYKIAADYDFYLQYQYKHLPFIKTSGHIYYDNAGFSQKNFINRDKEISLIIKKYFGQFHYIKFQIKSFLKRIIKQFL